MDFSKKNGKLLYLLAPIHTAHTQKIIHFKLKWIYSNEKGNKKKLKRENYDEKPIIKPWYLHQTENPAQQQKINSLDRLYYLLYRELRKKTASRSQYVFGFGNELSVGYGKRLVLMFVFVISLAFLRIRKIWNKLDFRFIEVPSKVNMIR